jgi:hypothetical protein
MYGLVSEHVIFKGAHQQLLKLFAIQPVADVLDHSVYYLLVSVELPVASFYHELVLFLNLLDQDVERVVNVEHQLWVSLDAFS